jgi:hypothetical protein
MLKQILHRQVAGLERTFGYDASYLHEVIDISVSAFFKFALFQAMSAHRQNVPRDAWYAARIAAALSEDCGPCTQLVVDMAVRDGMPPQAVSALLRGDLDRAGKDAEFGFRYGLAVAKNTEDASALSEKAAALYGKQALVSLAFAVACSRVYPTLKRGLGHGVACTRIKIANETIILKQAA